MYVWGREVISKSGIIVASCSRKLIRQVSMLPICTARLARDRLSYCKSNKPLLSHKCKGSILPHIWVLGITQAEPNLPSWWFDEICSRRFVGGRFQRLTDSSNIPFSTLDLPEKARKAHHSRRRAAVKNAEATYTQGAQGRMQLGH